MVSPQAGTSQGWAALIPGPTGPATATPPTAGEPAPEFTTRTQYGEPVGPADLRAKPYLLVFFPYAFTGICTGELAQLQNVLAQWRELGVRVLTISCDAMFSLRVFADQEGYEFDLLTDHWPHGRISQLFGVFDQTAGCAVRATFWVDPTGTVQWSVVNPIGQARDMTAPLEFARGVQKSS